MPTGNDKQWFTLAANFPAGLNTDADATRLTDGETPDAWNMDIDHPGWLAVGTASTGTAPIVKTFTIATVVYTWHYLRLWLISGANLQYGYPEYQTAYLPHEVPLGFFEDTNSLITFFPCLGTDMFVAKSSGGYLIKNAADPGGSIYHGDIEPAMGVTTASHGIELDSIPYVNNASGLYAWDGQNVGDITKSLKGYVTAQAARTLWPLKLWRDVARRRITAVSGVTNVTQWVWDAVQKKMFDYSQTGFRFTSRALQMRMANKAEQNTFAVDQIGFFYDNTTLDNANITLQVKRDKDWEDAESFVIPYADGTLAWMNCGLRNRWNAKNFQMRIIDMTTGLRIKSILVQTDLPSQTEQAGSQ